MEYTITVPDTQEPCITAARESYNASIPPLVPDPENPGEAIPNPDLKADNAAYMTWVMQNAALSYCAMYGIDPETGEPRVEARTP